MRIYFYPALKKENGNPYTTNFRKELMDYGSIVNDKPTDSSPIWDLLKHIFDTDVYFFNWIENTSKRRLGFIQTILFLWIILPVLRIRRSKLIWVFHNFIPHGGDNYGAKQIRKAMMKHSSLIVTHSRSALMYLKECTQVEVIFLHHPIVEFEELGDKTVYEDCDILIWGTIFKYKNVLEFVEHTISCKEYQKYNISIIGKCSDKEYDENLRKKCGKIINYENRRITFAELQARIRKSRYVLFPYLSSSVSSSGALIDTIALGGTPIGPNKGEFHDLKEEKVCFTFSKYEDVLEYLKSNRSVDLEKKNAFIKENSWSVFVTKIMKHINL